MFNKVKILSVLLLTVVFAATALVPSTAQAARVQPIENVENAPVPSGLDLRTVRNAIIDGCAARNWMAREIEEGVMECTVKVRSHTAVVNITYSTEMYSITYASSENLKYKEGKIHRNYNSWVQNLNGDIQNALLKASR